MTGLNKETDAGEQIKVRRSNSQERPEVSKWEAIESPRLLEEAGRDGGSCFEPFLMSPKRQVTICSSQKGSWHALGPHTVWSDCMSGWRKEWARWGSGFTNSFEGWLCVVSGQTVLYHCLCYHRWQWESSKVSTLLWLSRVHDSALKQIFLFKDRFIGGHCTISEFLPSSSTQWACLLLRTDTENNWLFGFWVSSSSEVAH